MQNDKDVKKFRDLLSSAEELKAQGKFSRAFAKQSMAIGLAMDFAVCSLDELHSLCSDAAITLESSRTRANHKTVTARQKALLMIRHSLQKSLWEAEPSPVQQKLYIDDSINTALVLIDYAEFEKAIFVLETALEAVPEADWQSIAGDHVSILARLVFSYLELGRSEKADQLQQKIAELVEDMTIAELYSDPYLFEAVSLFMENELEIWRRKADTQIDQGEDAAAFDSLAQKGRTIH